MCACLLVVLKTQQGRHVVYRHNIPPKHQGGVDVCFILYESSPPRLVYNLLKLDSYMQSPKSIHPETHIEKPSWTPCPLRAHVPRGGALTVRPSWCTTLSWRSVGLSKESATGTNRLRSHRPAYCMCARVLAKSSNFVPTAPSRSRCSSSSASSSRWTRHMVGSTRAPPCWRCGANTSRPSPRNWAASLS